MAKSDDVETQVVDGVAIQAAQHDWAMGVFGPLLIIVWRGQPTETAALQINDRIWELTQHRPSGTAYINVIERGAPAPPPAVRKLVMAGIARCGTAITCKCAVIEGNEIRSVFVRAILTSMELLRSRQQPTKFLKTTREMSEWVTKQLPESGVSADEIVRAAEVIRSQMPI